MKTLSEPNAVYKCFIHDFETTSIDEWFTHKVNLTHYDIGISQCIYCNKAVKFDGIVQESKDVLVPAKCPNCAPKNEADANCELIPQALPAPEEKQKGRRYSDDEC